MITDAHVHCLSGALNVLVRALDLAGIDRAVVLAWPGEGEAVAEEAERDGAGRLRVAFAPDLRLAGTARWDAELGRIERLTPSLAGLKIYKDLGFGITNLEGKRISLLSPELEPLWAIADGTGLPVILHCGDPADFWRRRPRLRAQQLMRHPEWQYARQPDVKPRSLMYRERAELVRRHPRVRFVGAHFGGFPDTPEALDDYLRLGPVDTSAALEEVLTFDRRAIGEVIAKHHGRIMWGSDVPVGPPPGRDTAAIKISAKFLADSLSMITQAGTVPAPTPLECPWTVAGLGLTGSARAEILHQTAARIFWRD
jgi:predicted TIM-barrel fold metal-dependent hydrolase